ncbi:MAG: protein kinase, partial [Lachnospiraceae bacterium]|nr:protein kinase [Lachnospiraceae bacterium]
MTIDERTKRQYAKVFHDWKIEGEMVGRGSQGKTAVFKIIKENSGFTETGALKIVNIYEVSLNENEGVTEEIEREIAAVKKKAEKELAAMNRMKGHANIVSYHEFQFEEYGDQKVKGVDLLIRMDFLENVGSREKEGMIYSETEIVKMGRDLSRALTDCHRKGILHRDIKPDNIFKNEYGYLLGDFGIAKYSEESGLMASTMAGSYPYAAPEQFRVIPTKDRDGKYDERVDIYALGLSLYELANDNKIPFAASTYKRQEDIQKRLNGTSLPAIPRISKALQNIILKACAFQPEDRYRSAEELYKELDRLQSQQEAMADHKDHEELSIEKAVSAAAPTAHEETAAAIPSQPFNGAAESYDPEETMAAESSASVVMPEGSPAGAAGSINETVSVRKPASSGGSQENEAPYYHALDNFTPPEPVKEEGKKSGAGAWLLISVCVIFLIGVIWYTTEHISVEIDPKEEVTEETGTIELAEESVQTEMKAEEPTAVLAQADSMAEAGDYEGAAELILQNMGDSLDENKEIQEIYLEYAYQAGMSSYSSEDYAKALEWLTIAAEGGHAEAQNQLGVMYEYGEGVEQDYQKAMECYQLAADQGDVFAQYNLAVLYDQGKGIEQDYQKAMEYYQLAADQGHAAAQYNLALMYHYGYVKGVAKDYQKAVEYYQLSADQGYAPAQNGLGYMYQHGEGVAQDYQKAMKYYQLAADQGDATAQNNLGYMYEEGEGVAQDYQKAMEYYQLAADQGNALAQCNLALMYVEGKGVEQDYQKAMKYYQLAADQGYAPAQYRLACMYEDGKGTEKDIQKAKDYYRLSADQGNEDAQEALDRLTSDVQVKVLEDAHDVTVRERPDAGSTKIGSLKDNGIYTRHEVVDNEWSRIEFNGQDGYSKTEFFEEITETSEATATQGATNKSSTTDNTIDKDTYSNISSFVKTYYTAMFNGDSAKVASMCDILSKEEQYRIEEKAKYYQKVTNFTIYVKQG